MYVYMYVSVNIRRTLRFVTFLTQFSRRGRLIDHCTAIQYRAVGGLAIKSRRYLHLHYTQLFISAIHAYALRQRFSVRCPLGRKARR